MLLMFQSFFVRFYCCFGHCFNSGVIVCMMLLLFLWLIQFCCYCSCDALDFFVISTLVLLFVQCSCCFGHCLCDAIPIICCFHFVMLWCLSTTNYKQVQQIILHSNVIPSFFTVSDFLLFLYSAVTLLP